MTRGLLAAAVLLLAAPGAARAAEVSVTYNCPKSDDPCETQVRFQAAAGELNVLELSRAGGATRIADRGATIAPGPGCVATDAHTAVCEQGDASIDLGDGNDTATVRGKPQAGDHVFGGDGDDRLTGFQSASGGPGADTLTGSDFTDLLYGGEGSDRLLGAAGDDRLSGDGPEFSTAGEIASDVLDGGPGADQAVYDRARAVRVDLADPGPDGGPGEADRLAGIEGAIGGSGTDTLIGDAGPNVLDGGRGDDRIDCGGGVDLVNDDDPLLTGCERLRIEGTPTNLTITPARIGRGLLTLQLPCSRFLRRDYRPGSCRVILTASQPGRRAVLRRRLPPGGGRVSVDMGVPTAPLRLHLRYPGSFDGAARAMWRIPEGGHPAG